MNATLAGTATMTEPRRRGRPPKGLDTASIRIEADVRDLARKAGNLRNETIIEYISRTIREVAEAELLEDARRTIAEAEAKARSPKR